MLDFTQVKTYNSNWEMWSKSFNITMIYVIQKKANTSLNFWVRDLLSLLFLGSDWHLHLWTEVNVLHNHLVYIIKKDNA